MEYRAIGLMSGSSLDGLDIVYVTFQEQGGSWTFLLEIGECIPYTADWVSRLQHATSLSAADYCVLHTDYGRYLGQQVNAFIERHQLQYKVAVIGSHGHTTFHRPDLFMTAQLGDGAALAAQTGLAVVSDLRALDVALGGQGAPIVPIGEKFLFAGTDYFLNLGGIANISRSGQSYKAFDICPANRVLNMLAAREGLAFDRDGALAAKGQVHASVLEQLNALSYYGLPYPKSLANDFGTHVVYPLLMAAELSTADALATYTEHIACQVKNSALLLHQQQPLSSAEMLVTGGGALNISLVGRIAEQLHPLGITTRVPEATLVNFKEALIMAFMGVLRWRQETTTLASVTGASRNSIGGALWTGQEA